MRPELNAAFELLDARSAVLGDALVVVQRQWHGRSESELQEAIATVERRERPLVGFLLARSIAQTAAVTGSAARLKDFLFRFGMHLFASAGVSGGSADAVVVAIAARACLTRASAHTQVYQVEEVLARLPEVSQKPEAWRRQLGQGQEQFEHLLDVVVAGLPAGRPRTTGTARERIPVPQPTLAVALAKPPAWLGVPKGQVAPQKQAEFLLGSRAWRVASREEAEDVDSNALNSAWSSFRSGDYLDARLNLDSVLFAAGTSWWPSSSPDGLRVWNWLRLVCLLSKLESGTAGNRRRAYVSALECALRSVPDETALLESLLESGVSDFVVVEPESRQAWAVYLARLVSVADPDEVLAYYTNETRADLRTVWSERFSGLVSKDQQSRQMVDTLAAEFHNAVGGLKDVVGREGSHRQIVRPLRRLSPFLDTEEQALADRALIAAASVTRVLGREQATATELTQTKELVGTLVEDLLSSDSLLLQDGVGPFAEQMQVALALELQRASDASQPHVSAMLLTHRLPLSSTVSAPFRIAFRIRNDGNARADLIECRLDSADLQPVGESRVVDALDPGQEAEISFEASVVSPGQGITVTMRCEWRDVLEQQFSQSFPFQAEDQRATSWKADDVNPFSLGTISEPRRLVGRSADLAALERSVAAGGSAYVTGQKRVGKTSLVKVLQRTLQTDGWVVAYLPLGQALSGSADAPDVLLALLEAIYDECLHQRPDVTLPEPPVDEQRERYARAVGRWLRAVNRIADNAQLRVLVALDDFDTLPSALYMGSDAEALFRTLRTLVDTSWLGLIFIGSEVLPTILKAQAHQLNQVGRFSLANFASTADTKALLEGAASARLDWDPHAFARAHYLCSGNPYYLNLLGRELWQYLRERDRSYVTQDDVDWSAEAVARSGDPSHFLHLWADDPSGLDSGTRRSLLASASLRAVARASGKNFGSVARSESVGLARQWVPSATLGEWNGTFDGLISRQVLLQDGDALRLAIPLVSAWLQNAGAMELDRQYAAIENARVDMHVIPNRELLDLTEDLHFCGDRVSEIALQAWLEQFETGRPRWLAFQVARRLLAQGYFSATRMSAKVLPQLRTAIQASPPWGLRQKEAGGFAKNVYMLQHGVAGASAPVVTANLSALLKIRKANIVSAEAFSAVAARRQCVLIIADDVVGTGEQLAGVTRDLVGSLDSQSAGWRESVNLVVAAAVSAQTELWLPENVQSYSVVGHVARPDLLAFDPSAKIFSSEEDRLACEDLFRVVGAALEPKHPLGFGDLALLAATESNCPNNAPPVLWKTGAFAGGTWRPLLRRRV